MMAQHGGEFGYRWPSVVRQLFYYRKCDDQMEDGITYTGPSLKCTRQPENPQKYVDTHTHKKKTPQAYTKIMRPPLPSPHPIPTNATLSGGREKTGEIFKTCGWGYKLGTVCITMYINSHTPF